MLFEQMQEALYLASKEGYRPVKWIVGPETLLDLRQASKGLNYAFSVGNGIEFLGLPITVHRKAIGFLLEVE